MLDERIELAGSVEIADKVHKKIKAVGVRGLDINEAKRLGVFDRISNLLCAAHASIMAAYRIYGNADYMLQLLGGRKNEISKEMNAFEKSYDRFISFWTDYYAHDGAGKEMNGETEALYHQIMKWAQLPEVWNIGDNQRLNDAVNIAIKIEREQNTDLFFYKSVVDVENTDDIQESWCVTKFDEKTMKQTTVNTQMDKASALMVAKRLSEEDKECIYTASLVQDIKEKRTEVTPFKAFKCNTTIGTIKNVFK